MSNKTTENIITKKISVITNKLDEAEEDDKMKKKINKKQMNQLK